MKCPKCGAEVSSEAAMCPKCGAFTGRAEQPAAQQPQPKSKLKPAWIAAGVLAVVIIIALVIMLLMPKQSITQAPAPTASTAPAITNATVPPASGPAITNAPPPVPTPTQPGVPQVKKPAPPPEVVDYLNFVKGIEQQRQALLKDTSRAVTMAAGASQAQSMLDAIDIAMDDSGNTKPKGATKVATELDSHVGNWNNLLGRFESKPAPAQCRDFSGNYRLVLRNEVAGMTRINAIFKSVDWSNLESIKTTINQLQQLKADPNLQGSIDKAVEVSDGNLTTLCSAYDMTKPFDVKKEEPSASIIAPGM